MQIIKSFLNYDSRKQQSILFLLNFVALPSLIVFLKGSQVFTRFAKLAFLHVFLNESVDISAVCIKAVKFEVVESQQLVELHS